MKESTKHKISIALRGRVKLATHKKRISQSLKGVKKSPKHKAAIAEALREYYRNKNNGNNIISL